MIKFRLVLLVTICFYFLFTAERVVGQIAYPPVNILPVRIEASSSANSAYSTDSSNVPKGVTELAQASRAKYIEGYSLIRSGECDQAKKSFDLAINMLLQSDWDIEKTPYLKDCFRELIQQIKEAESRYLFPTGDLVENIEGPFFDDIENLDLMAISDDPKLINELSAGLTKNEFDIPITINEMVLKSLEFWLNRGRKYYADGLIRSGQYRTLIEQVFKEESIPLDLINLAQVESFFKTDALSKAQAKGIWQFGKNTAIRYGLKVTKDVDERSDPEKSTRAAARYLNDLYRMFKDWNLVLAAYNWGEGKVKRLMDSTGLNDFWQLADLKKRFPEETRRHIPLIQASAILAKDPAKFGLPTEWNPPLKYTKVSISKPIDLHAAAKVLSTTFDEIKKLNPSLKGMSTPANYPNFVLKVPIDSTLDANEILEALPKARIRKVAEFSERHLVKKGETIARIARKYHVTEKALFKENGLSSKSIIKVGAYIKVPKPYDTIEDGEIKKTKNDSKSSKKIKTSASKGKVSLKTKEVKKRSNSKKIKAVSANKSSKSVKKADTKQKPSK
jgi:membrane-bound lytic murein transglycosylase D